MGRPSTEVAAPLAPHDLWRQLGQVQAFREKHYAAKRKGPRPMLRSKRGEPATWFSYMSKLIAFGKVADAMGARTGSFEQPAFRGSTSGTWLSAAPRRLFFACIAACSKGLWGPDEWRRTHRRQGKGAKRQAKGYGTQGWPLRPLYWRDRHEQPSRSNEQSGRSRRVITAAATTAARATAKAHDFHDRSPTWSSQGDPERMERLRNLRFISTSPRDGVGSPEG